jgi:hypothetical protein
LRKGESGGFVNNLTILYHIFSRRQVQEANSWSFFDNKGHLDYNQVYDFITFTYIKMGGGENMKIKEQQVFDENKNEISDQEKKAISENLADFQAQFGDFKSEILHNLDTANKNILVDLYDNDTETK